jgi:hypothetical protein
MFFIISIGHIHFLTPYNVNTTCSQLNGNSFWDMRIGIEPYRRHRALTMFYVTR